MELIIKLDDDIAKGIRGENECEVEPREIVRSFQATITDAITNGTPYNPTGDLISREALKEAVKNRFDNSEYFPFHFLALIDNAPTIPLPILNEQTAWEQGYEAGLAQGKQDRPKENERVKMPEHSCVTCIYGNLYADSEPCCHCTNSPIYSPALGGDMYEPIEKGGKVNE